MLSISERRARTGIMPDLVLSAFSNASKTSSFALVVDLNSSAISMNNGKSILSFILLPKRFKEISSSCFEMQMPAVLKIFMRMYIYLYVTVCILKMTE